MEVKREYIAVILLLLAVGILYYYQAVPREKGVRFAVIGDPLDMASFLDVNAVVVRAVYPFSDIRGASNAVVYLSSVFTAKGKTAIIQYVDGNTCYTNEGNVEKAVEKNLSDCLLPLPTIEIREGTNRVVIEKNKATIYADPPDMIYGASLVAKMVYPDADQVYQSVMSAVGRIRKPAS
jgi:hypothetical protein